MQGRTLIESAQLRNDQLVSIAELVEDDAEANIEYRYRITEESDFLTFAPGELATTVEEESGFIRGLYARRAGLMLKATVDGKIVSTAGIQRVKRSRVEHVGELGIAVRRDFWNLGVGRLICDCAVREARAMGLKRVEPKVRTDNVHAIRVYQSLGFQTEGIRRRSFLVAGTFFDEALMAILFD